MKSILTALLVLSVSVSFSQNNYENAWHALNENKRGEAEELLNRAMAQPATSQEAYITNIYLQTYNGKEKDITGFIPDFYEKSANPYPYIYSLWFNNAVIGGYEKKTSKNQIGLLDKLLSDPKVPGTLVASADYQKVMHYIFSADFDKVKPYSKQIGNLRNWQYTGPFENLSESGFYKNYGPLEHPESTAVFKSVSNAEIKWFTPPEENDEGWTPALYQFNKSAAVIYAQNFVESPVDQKVLCNIGCSGTIKVWINDELVISDFKSHTTGFDSYTIKYDLKKGTNRVLVQLGYTNVSYPSFSVRFTDGQFRPVTNITGSPVYAAYPKNKIAQKNFETIPQFAEKYFEDKIAKHPADPVNYLLLADAYLRSDKLLEARSIISKALENAPENSLLRVKLLQILDKENNKTAYLEELEKIKKADPESVIVLDLKIKEYYNNEKYEDCAAELEKRIKIHGENKAIDGYKLLLLIQEKKYDEMVTEVQKFYNNYPDDPGIVKMMYNIKKEVNKDVSGARKVYEKYMKSNYNYDSYMDYANLLLDQGNTKKGIAIKEKLAKRFSYDPNGFYNLSKYYYSAKDYKEAENYINKSLALSPYNESYWEQLGDIKNEKKDVAGALDCYNQSLKFDQNQYDIISKIRKLKGKPDIYKLFPQVDIEKVIKEDKPEDAKSTDYGFYYILDQKDVVIYPDGANEEYLTTILRITNTKGVDRFKESTIGYNNAQTLLIEKAEIIKKNQSKIDGERNGNQIVFTNLEAGDIIVFKYRLQNYVYGRFAREYWDKYFFGGQVYAAKTNYNMLVPAGQKINYVFSNSKVQPAKKSIEDFDYYSWSINDPEPLKSEPFMPLTVDEGTVLHISTIPAWKEIANWYSDIVNNKSEEDFEIRKLYKELFPDTKKPMSEFDKAKIIYNYIEANIRYSSVPFRQSAFVPQRASATLTTRLGDCKDLSNLFVTIAGMAGIDAQMVLIDTRDNGQKDMLLPSVEFNHCIVKAALDHKEYYIELTDNYLPFTCLPNNLNGALALEIPKKSGNENAVLISLKPKNRKKDIIKRVIHIRPENNDLDIDVNTVAYGTFSEDYRSDFKDQDNDKQKQDMEKSIARKYKNNVRLETVQFGNLDDLNDSVTCKYNYKVKNEVAEIGSLKTFKITYPDIVATLDNFSADTRVYPIEYWRYEMADAYESVVYIDAPEGMDFVELPEGQTLSFKDMKYSIQYQLNGPGKLMITRKFTNERNQQIAPEDYKAFKSFFEKIVRAEQKFIAYK